MCSHPGATLFSRQSSGKICRAFSFLTVHFTCRQELSLKNSPVSFSSDSSVDQVFQWDTAKIILDQRIELFPKRAGRADRFPFTFSRIFFKTCYRCKRSLCETENGRNRIILRSLSELIATAFSAKSKDQTTGNKRLENIFKIFFRNLLPWCDFLEWRISIRILSGSIMTRSAYLPLVDIIIIIPPALIRYYYNTLFQSEFVGKKKNIMD